MQQGDWVLVLLFHIEQRCGEAGEIAGVLSAKCPHPPLTGTEAEVEDMASWAPSPLLDQLECLQGTSNSSARSPAS